MNKRLFVILIIILICLLLFINKQAKNMENADILKNRVFSEDELDNIDKMEFEFRTGEKISFKLNDKEWHMIEPKKFQCDNDSVNSIIRSLKELDSYTKLKGEEVKIEDYGFENPNMKITLNNHSNSILIKTGNLTFDSSKRFLLFKNTIYAVSNYFEKTVDKEYLFFKKKDIFRIAENDVGKWHFYSKDFDIHYNSKEPESFRIKVQRGKEKLKFDKNIFHSLFKEFLNINAIKWVELKSQDLNDYSFENSDYGIEFFTKDDEKVFSAVIVKRNDKLILKDLNTNNIAEISDSFEYYLEKLIIEKEKGS